MPDVNEEPQVMARGPNFVYAKEFILEEHGVDTWAKILANLRGTAAQAWQGPLAVTEAYPFSAFKEMFTAYARIVDSSTERETARLYQYIADRSLSAIYKLILRFAEPSFVIARFPQLWKRFFQVGRVEVSKAERGHAVLHFHLPEVLLHCLPAAFVGYSTRAVELAGGRDLEVTRLEQVQEPDGDWKISFELRWQE